MATKKQDLAQFLESRIKLTGKTQREIAREAGIPSINFISMMKAGKAKVPLRRVPALAAALDVPPIDLMFRCLKAQEPELTAILASLLKEVPRTADEIALLRGYRILREQGVLDEDGVELRSLGAKGRKRAWATITRNASGRTEVEQRTLEVVDDRDGRL
jgi:transcriptional regulator with XRE-family HTH domain